VLGGGVSDDDPANVDVLESYPLDNSHWYAVVNNSDTVNHNVTIYAICANVN
jgi:hypothetical protein